MAYTVTFKQDTITPGVGTVTARDEATGFTYSRRVKTGDVADAKAFVEECKAKSAALAASQATTKAICDKIAAALNKVEV